MLLSLLWWDMDAQNEQDKVKSLASKMFRNHNTGNSCSFCVMWTLCHKRRWEGGVFFFWMLEYQSHLKNYLENRGKYG